MARYSSNPSPDAEMTSPEEQQIPPEIEKLVSGRVHVLGSGNMATFIAHSLAKRQSPPDVTLIMRHWGIYEAYRQRKKKLSVSYGGLSDVLKRGLDIEVLTGKTWYSVPRYYGEKYNDIGERLMEEPAKLEKTNEPIDCLIVCCRSNHAFTNIHSLAHRLSPDSTIVIVQNGLGVVDRLNKMLYQDPSQRPHFLHAVFTHGLDKNDMFQSKFTRIGTTNIAPPVPEQLSMVKPEDDTTWAPSTKYLMRLFTLTPSLVATVNTPTNVLMDQLEKHAVACVIQPLTALNDCRNGDLLYITSVTRIIRLLLFEISRVIMALPELQGVPGLEDRFTPERLRRIIISQLSRTRDNTSTMVHDVRGRKGSEIEYLNGYIVRRGEELGITCVMNYMIKHMVHAKQRINNQQEMKAIPIDDRLDDSDLLTDYPSSNLQATGMRLTGHHITPLQPESMHKSPNPPQTLPEAPASDEKL